MKNIAKLMFKCIAVLLPFWLLWIYTALCFEKYASGEAAYYNWNKELTKNADSLSYDTLIIGDSTANTAYISELLSDGTLNLSLGGTTPAEGYYTLYNYLQNHTPPKTCYVSYYDIHFHGQECFWSRAVEYHMLDYSQLREMYDRAEYHNEDSVLQNSSRDENLRKIAEYYAYWPARYMPSLMNSGLNGRAGEYAKQYENISLHRGVYLLNAIYEVPSNKQLVYDNFYIDPMYDEYYRKIAGLCRNYSIQLRLVKLPLAPQVIYDENYVGTISSYYEDLKMEYPEITADWVNAGFERSDFSDDHHLNYHGAIKFIQVLKDMHPDDFSSVGYYERYNEALMDYTRKVCRADDMVEFAYYMKTNCVVFARSGADWREYFKKYEKYEPYAYTITTDDGDTYVLYNFAEHSIEPRPMGWDGRFWDDNINGEIRLECSDYTKETCILYYPDKKEFTVADNKMVDIGVFIYSENGPLLTKEFYYRDSECSQVVSK